MNSDLPDPVRELASFVPPADDWQRLDSIACQIFARPVTQPEIAALLGIFERYPAHDGYGVFWSILHGLESLPDYEPLLLASVRRVPSEFGILMVGSILNGGQQDIAGSPIRAALSELLQRADTAPDSKRYIQTILNRNA